MKKKVVVGMSGGVDSSVAAYLLKEQGYDVIGVTMQIWQDEDEEQKQDNGGCCGLSAVDDARRVAQMLDIPYYVMNFKNEFKKDVIDYFVKEYLVGRTPNPCIACNRHVKWEALLKRSLDIGADYIATGHYARITQLSNGRYAIANSVASKKDQTYALYNLTQEQLAHTLMPVGEYTKEDIRAIAEREGLVVAHKPDSQEICFIPDNNYAGYIEKAAGEMGLAVPPMGDFVRPDGEVLGTHKGIMHYTIGQRRGLGLPMGDRIYVTDINPETNQVVLGDNADLFKTELKCYDLNFMGMSADELGEISVGDSLDDSSENSFCAGDIAVDGDSTCAIDVGEKGVECIGKIRYGHQGAPCVIKRTGEDEITAIFSEPVRAITPGQSAVFYRDGNIICGGTIK